MVNPKRDKHYTKTDALVTGLELLMKKLGVQDEDIKESFIRSSKPGGQNVNKVSTCVQLTHVPSGIQVKCEESRSQAVNRAKAKYLLIKKIEQNVNKEKARKKQEREKKKRQTRKRPKAVKEEILKGKHHQSEKKSRRRKISPSKVDPERL